jgi:hypothetical protein
MFVLSKCIQMWLSVGEGAPKFYRHNLPRTQAIQDVGRP